MRSTGVAGAAAFLLSHIGVAGATSATLLTENDAFLLGNAHRCCVANERVARAGRVIHDLIVAASDNASDQEAAKSRFAVVYVASTNPEEPGLIPPCEVVVRQFDRLERHHAEGGLKRARR